MADRRNDDDVRHKPGSRVGPATDNKAKPAAEKPASNTGAGPAASLVPSLPKGSGAIRGLAKNFSANPVTGTASLQIPLAVNPAAPAPTPISRSVTTPDAGNAPSAILESAPCRHVADAVDRLEPRVAAVTPSERAATRGCPK